MKRFRSPFILLVFLVAGFVLLSLSLIQDQTKSRRRAPIENTAELEFRTPSKKTGDLSILLESRRLNGRTFEVFVTLSGSTQYDTAEAFLKIPSEVFEVTDVSDGTALDFCPRKQVEKDFVRVTCVSNPDTVSGRLNQPLAVIRLYVRKPFDKGRIKIDEEGTNIYFKGQEVTRSQSTPLQVQL